MLVHFKMYIWY